MIKLEKKKPKQERSKLTVESILGAVSMILDRDGPVGMTTNKIAEVAGISVGSLYQYFKNKESIFEAILVRMTEDNLKQLEENISQIKGELNIREIIKIIVQSQYENLEKMGSVYSVLFEYAHQLLSPAHFRKADEKIVKYLIETIDKNNIMILPKNHELAFFVCSQAVRSVLYMSFLNKKQKDERQKVIDELVDMLTRYLERP